MKITIENWTTSHYFSDPLRAFISLGAAPANEHSSEVLIEYNVTTTDKEFVEVFQSTHGSLEAAITEINSKFSQWNMIDASGKVDGDGCSSCAAH
jgi:hypothetical protein